MAVKAFRSPMRVLPPLAREGAGGIRGSTSSQNLSLTVQGLVRAIPTATTPSLAEILDFHRSYQFSDKVLSVLLLLQERFYGGDVSQLPLGEPSRTGEGPVAVRPTTSSRALSGDGAGMPLYGDWRYP